MIGHCDARAALTGHCDVKAALFGRRGGETHASSAAAWSYGTDRNGTSASARGQTKSDSEGETGGGKKEEDKARETHREGRREC